MRTDADGSGLQSHEEVLELLGDLNREFRAHFEAGRSARDLCAPAGTNAKGDTRRQFDLEADAWVQDWLVEHARHGVVDSEEGAGEVAFGDPSQGYRFVVDPIDGSDNLARGLPLSALSVAVLPRSAPLSLENVIGALVGDVTQGRPGAVRPHLAARGRGAVLGGDAIRTSGTRRLRDALVSVELNHLEPDGELGIRLGRVLGDFSGVRAYGCASRALTLVASGALDAHIDIRSRLTPESFLAASLLVLEAGGTVSTIDGAPLGPFSSLLERTTLVAAATGDLAKEIIDALTG